MWTQVEGLRRGIVSRGGNLSSNSTYLLYRWGYSIKYQLHYGKIWQIQWKFSIKKVTSNPPWRSCEIPNWTLWIADPTRHNVLILAISWKFEVLKNMPVWFTGKTTQRRHPQDQPISGTIAFFPFPRYLDPKNPIFNYLFIYISPNKLERIIRLLSNL